jgi:hypothetical protein
VSLDDTTDPELPFEGLGIISESFSDALLVADALISSANLSSASFNLSESCE